MPVELSKSSQLASQQPPDPTKAFPLKWVPMNVNDTPYWCLWSWHVTGRNASESDYLLLWALIAYGVVHNRMVIVALHRTMDYGLWTIKVGTNFTASINCCLMNILRVIWCHFFTNTKSALNAKYTEVSKRLVWNTKVMDSKTFIPKVNNGYLWQIHQDEM